MVSQKEISHLKSLSLEDRAQMPKKVGVPDSIIACTFIFILIGILTGLYYWFINDIIFTYDSVSPFWGFVLFLLIGFLMCILCSSILAYIDNAVWKNYNSIIYSANKGLISNIRDGYGTDKQFDIFLSSCRERKTVPSTYIRSIMTDDIFTPQQQEQLRIAYIESMIGSDDIRQADFEWHTERVCWGCGNDHRVPPKAFKVTDVKTQTWREGVYRHTQDFGTSTEVLLCPDCYERLSNVKEDEGDFANIMEKIYTIIGYVITIGLFVLSIIFMIVDIITGKGFNFDYILAAIGYTFISWGLFFGVGWMRFVFLPIWIIASIIHSLMHKGKADSHTKWNFNDIPRLRRFRSNNQRGLRAFK